MPPQTQPLHDRPALLACVAKLQPGVQPALPLAVDFVRFTNPDKHLSNAPAVLILLPHQIGSKDLAFIVGPNCTTAPDQDIYFVAVVPTSS